METFMLLGQYAEILNEYDGPDSNQAKQFFEKNKNNQEFAELAETAAHLWRKHHIKSE